MKMLSFFMSTLFASSAVSALKVAPTAAHISAMKAPVRATFAYDLPDTFEGVDLNADPEGSLEGQSERNVKHYECGMCGGAADGCPMCRGPAPAAFHVFNALGGLDSRSSFS